MQIYPTNNLYHNNKQPSFRQWCREVRIPHKGFLNRNDTSFFRDENFLPRLTRFMYDNFKDIPKVNVYCYGCSDGSEPFTFAMRMLSMKEEDARKFLPIIARDIDSVAINKALKNDYELTKREKDYIDHFTYKQYDRFFDGPYEEYVNSEDYSSQEVKKVLVKKELYDYVDFGLGNILKDYKKIKPQDTVLLARNFWPYLGGSSVRIECLKNLYKHFDKNCYLVTGEFDHRGTLYKIENEILNAGFNKTPLEYVYVKK